jgi:hypothetical protein
MKSWLNVLIPALIIGVCGTLFSSIQDITMLKTEDINIQRELIALKAGQARIMQFLLQMKKN